jgi:hypothetical protein
MLIRITDIKWDAEEGVDLPTEVILDTDVENMEDPAMEAADWLSDKYGWCVEGFSHEPVAEPSLTPTIG